MSFNWGGLVSTVTGGLYSPGSSSSPSVPKYPTEKKRTVGKTAQAGGGQIKYNTEETYLDDGSGDGSSRTIINPDANKKNSGLAGLGFGSKKQPATNFYTGVSQSGSSGGLGFAGGKTSTSEEGQRAEAAKRLGMGWK